MQSCFSLIHYQSYDEVTSFDNCTLIYDRLSAIKQGGGMFSSFNMAEIFPVSLITFDNQSLPFTLVL